MMEKHGSGSDKAQPEDLWIQASSKRRQVPKQTITAIIPKVVAQIAPKRRDYRDIKGDKLDKPTAIKVFSPPRDASKILKVVTPTACPVGMKTTAPVPKKSVPKNQSNNDSYDIMMFVKSSTAKSAVCTKSLSADTQNKASSHGVTATAKKKTEINEEFVKHRFIPAKKKKKIFSKIKKQILTERLRNHVKRKAELIATAGASDLGSSVSQNDTIRNTIPLSSNITIQTPSDNGSLCKSDSMGIHYSEERDVKEATYSSVPISPHEVFTSIPRSCKDNEHDLYLLNAIFWDDISDEEEAGEVLNDLFSLCELFGGISAVWIEKMEFPPILSSDVPFSGTCNPPKCPWIFIEFDDESNALQAANCLNGLEVGGEKLEGLMYDFNAYSRGLYDERYCRDPTLGNIPPLQNFDKAAAGGVIVVKYYLSTDDLEGCNGDTEEIGAMKRDLITLSLSNRTDNDVFIKRISIITSTDSDSYLDKKRSVVEDGSEESRGELAACVRFSCMSSAMDAVLSLDGTLLGGSSLKASLRRSISAPYPLPISLPLTPAHSIKGDEVTGNVVYNGHIEAANIIALKHFDTTHAQASNSQDNKDIALGSSVVEDASRTEQDSGSNVDLNPESSEVAIDQHTHRRTHTPHTPQTSIYKEAALAPKLDKNIASSHSIKVASEEVDGFVKEFLNSIATFQEKLKERDPLKAAAKRRFVMGMKQATNCVKAGLVKLLLLAPDSEASEAIEGVLNILLEEARVREVPVLHCLNRRKLGKAAHSSMKQVVVAVIDADGAYENFKKVISFINQTDEGK